MSNSPRRLPVHRVLIAVLVGLITVGSAARAGAQGPALLPHFGKSGRVLTGFGDYPQTSGSIEDLAVAADGRVAIATRGGGAKPIQVAVLRPDGTPDDAFSEDGLIQPQLEPGRPLAPVAVRLAFDGETLLVAGAIAAPEASTELRRYLPDGQLDRSFSGPKARGGARGIVTGDYSQPKALFVQPAGTIALFAGNVLARFGHRGKLLNQAATDAGNFGRAAIGPDGSFLASAGNEEEPFHSSILRFDPAGAQTHRVDLGESPPYIPSRIALAPSGAALSATLTGIVRLQPDDLSFDPGFHGDPAPCRKVVGTPIGFDKILPLADGRTLIAGGCGLARLEPNGTPDPSFGSGGLLAIDLSSAAVALAPEGAVVYATWGAGSNGPELRRVDPTGTPDLSFGSGGRAVVALRSPVLAEAAALAPAPDGGLVAAGNVSCPLDRCRGFALARYRSGGGLDRHFGHGGKGVSGRNALGSATAVVVAPNGTVIAAGQTSSRKDAESGRWLEPEFAIVELNRSGRFDPAFGDDGVVTDQLSPKIGQRSQITALARQRDGRIVVAGISQGCGGGGGGGLCYTVARYLSNGLRDPSFAHRGVFRLFADSTVPNAVAVAPDGKIVVTGGAYGNLVTIRLTRRGRLDPSFGSRGLVERPVQVRFHDGGHQVLDLSIAAKALAVERDGSVVIGGGARSSRSVLERYDPAGRPDRSFGRRGRMLLPGYGVSGLQVGRCGLVLAGTTRRKEGEPQMAVMAIGGDGQRTLLKPFGALRGTRGAALVLRRGGAGFLAGSLMPFSRSSEFALSGFRTRSLFGHC